MDPEDALDYAGGVSGSRGRAATNYLVMTLLGSH